jgi:hypothetical protein
MKRNALIFVALILVAAVLIAGCASSPSPDDMKFLDKVQESSNNILENNERIMAAFNAADWSAMKKYSDRQLIQADEAIFAIQLLQVTGKRIPAKEEWLKVLESTKTVAVHTGRAATAYEEGRISEDISRKVEYLGKGNDEMRIANDMLDQVSEHLDRFNALDLV